MIQTIVSLIDRIPFDRAFQIAFPDGTVYRRGDEQPVFRVHIQTERALREIMRHPSLGFGESCMSEEIDIEGDIQQFYRLGFLLKNSDIKPGLFEAVRLAVGYYLRRNTLEGSRKNIAAHYDLGNDFYSLWLDNAAMQYTCAYFETPEDTLEQAQLNKIDLVCRKLRLQPGDTVVEAGCGWGGFALRAATEFGVKIRSFNISSEQIAYARETAARLGVKNVEYVLDDYRNIASDSRQYDKFVSIGMLEHVGVENYATLYDIVARVVKPGGLAMIHSIGREAPSVTDAWIEKYIFPGSLMPSLSQMITPVEKPDRPLHVIDVENLRYHYALTLDHWAARLEKNADTIRARYGEAFYRMFLLYLHSSAAGFRWGGILLFQMLLCNGYDNTAPLTRRHFFATSPPENRSRRSNRAEKKRAALNGARSGMNGHSPAGSPARKSSSANGAKAGARKHSRTSR